MRINGRLTTALIPLFACLAFSASANNINVANIALRQQDVGAKTVRVQFDVGWENSWRDELNHDAAWVFVKFRPEGSNEWEHAYLSTNSASHVAAADSEIITVPDGTGVFIRRSGSYTGTVNYAATKLLWDYGSNGYEFAKGDSIEVMVHAIEMVFVAEGSFYVGSGGAEDGSFTAGPYGGGATTPFAITNELEIAITNAAGGLWGTSTNGNNTIGQAGVLSNAFPKGYAAFYCMKYEITQRQYVEFLNSLTYSQQVSRTAISPNSAAGTYLHNANRHAIKISASGVNPGTPASYETDNPYVACGYLSWMDGAAYAQWSGLRPMTELEFEKACRGLAGPVANEYAWGTQSYNWNQYTLADAGKPEESIATGYNETGTAGNCNVNGIYPVAYPGPLRVGIFAKAASDRVRAGATYWGIMEMGGNLWERMTAVGLARGRVFEGTHGDGKLSAAGHATQSDWPGWSGGAVTGADGASVRGGAWSYADNVALASHRNVATWVPATRANYLGWRGVRSACLP